MPTYRTRVSSKGQVVIPKRLRDRLHLQVGDRVSIEDRDRIVRITSRSGWARATAGILASSRPPLEAGELDEWLDRATDEDVLAGWESESR